MNKVGKTTMWMAGIGAVSYLSYKYILPKDKKDAMKNMASNMMKNMADKSNQERSIN